MKDQEKTESGQPAVQALDEETLDQVVAGNPTQGGLTSTMLSNVSKTRSEISMTFARNARA